MVRVNKIDYGKIVVKSPGDRQASGSTSFRVSSQPLNFTAKGSRGHLSVSIVGTNTEYIRIPKLAAYPRDKVKAEDRLSVSMNAVLLTRVVSRDELATSTNSVGQAQSQLQPSESITQHLVKVVRDEVQAESFLRPTWVWHRKPVDDVRMWDWLRNHSSQDRDQGTLSETDEKLSVLFEKRIYEEVTADDVFTRNKADRRDPEESSGSSELLATRFKKELRDSIGSAEELSFKNAFVKAFSSELHVLSSFNAKRKGEAREADNALPEERLALTLDKSINESVELQDNLTLSRVLPRSFSDAVRANVLISKRVSFPTATSVSHLEGFSVIPKPASSDSFGAQEEITRSLHRLIAEHVRATDTESHEHEKGGFEESAEDSASSAEKLSYRMQSYVVDGYFASTYVGEFKDELR